MNLGISPKLVSLIKSTYDNYDTTNKQNEWNHFELRAVVLGGGARRVEVGLVELDRGGLGWVLSEVGLLAGRGCKVEADGFNGDFA